MALDPTKWAVQTNKSIRYIGPAHGVAGANYVTVLEMHRWLQDLADDASSSNDDYMDITRDTPSDKSFDTIINLTNGYTLDTAYTTPADEYIYGGSIIQGGGTDIWDGIAVVANRYCYTDVIQNNARITNDFWNQTPNGEAGRGINFDAATGKSAQFMVKVRTAGGGGATAAEVWAYGSRTLTSAVAPTAEQNATATLAALIEGGLTLQDVLRIVLAVTSGDATGLEGSSMVFKSLDGTKNRVEASYVSGTRNVTAVDPS